jgi:hypothetical protein
LDASPITVIFFPATLLYNLSDELSENHRSKVNNDLNEIRNEIDSSIRHRFMFIDQYPKNLKHFIDILVDLNPHILHFSGSVLIANPVNSENMLSGSLIQLLERNPKKINCIMLSKCYSSSIAKTLVKYVDCVLGTSSEITDQKTIEFTSSFYSYLCKSISLGGAYDLADLILFESNKKSEKEWHDENSRGVILYKKFQEYKITRDTYKDVFLTTTILVENNPDISFYLRGGP